MDLIVDNVMDLYSGMHSIVVHSTLGINSIMASTLGTKSNIMGVVPVLVQPNSIIHHDAINNPCKTIVASKYINKIEIWLTDNRNNIINLNGLHFHVGMLFEFVAKLQQPKKPTTHALRYSNIQDTIAINNEKEKLRERIKKQTKKDSK